MSDSSSLSVPADVGPSGRRLWDSVLSVYELDEHELALFREMVRTVDLLDDLDAQVRADGLMVRGPGLTPRVHPAVAEARHARIALARLAAALRLPTGEEGDEQKGARQRRVGVRGVYGVRGVV
ncbi:terminase [Actinomadura sp. WAC 06369]|uniref:terminase n=1 Tax=Actinomadura sp. WAC 06369 TaxID=2203193 RepID=UPI000F77E6D1|nr:terminase [Actinomadura sp. WAC 06369]RSN71398.1 terminase [Actinomadura sp. WAC 06369]